jgi:hypothetical protein
MFWLSGFLLIIITGVVVWFLIPFSPMKVEFTRLKDKIYSGMKPINKTFTQDDIKGLPIPLQRYFIVCGFIGKQKMINIRMIHKDVDFIFSSKMPVLKIDCTQINSAEIPERVALIDTRLYGIPFQGIDAYVNGVGSMKGVIAKGITLFNQTGDAMNQSSLVNCLAESLLIPSIVLQDYIHWEAIDENSVIGTISFYGLSVSGIFHFDSKGFMDTFTTDDRRYVQPDGTVKNVKWSAVCADYREVGGFQQPKSVKAIWHMPEGDLVYFDSRETAIEYNITN